MHKWCIAYLFTMLFAVSWCKGGGNDETSGDMSSTNLILRQVEDSIKNESRGKLTDMVNPETLVGKKKRFKNWKEYKDSLKRSTMRYKCNFENGTFFANENSLTISMTSDPKDCEKRCIEFKHDDNEFIAANLLRFEKTNQNHCSCVKSADQRGLIELTSTEPMVMKLVSSCHIEEKTISELENYCREDDTCKVEIDQMNTRLSQIQAGLESGAEIADEIAERNPKNSRGTFAKKIGRLMQNVGPLLKAVGPMFSIAMSFYPSSESIQITELTEKVMKEFKKVHNKLDTIHDTIDNLEAHIDDAHMRDRYVESIDRVKSATKLMKDTLSAEKSTVEGFKTDIKLIKGVNEVLLAADRLSEGILDGTFMDIFIKVENSNRQKVQARMMDYYVYTSRAVEFYLFWLEVWSEDRPGYNKKYRRNRRKEWTKTLKKMLTKIVDLDSEYFLDDWETKYMADFEREAAISRSNAVIADKIYEYLQGKYDWRDTFLVVYDPIKGYHNHKIRYCEDNSTIGRHEFRWNNKNWILVNKAKSEEFTDKDHYQELLETADNTAKRYSRRSTHGKNRRRWGVDRHTAEYIFDNGIKWSPADNNCDTVDLSAVINQGAHIATRAPPGRKLEYRLDGHLMIIMD